MLEYLEKFKQLPAELRQAVASESAVKTIGELEARFGVSLAETVIRVMVKDLALAALPAHFVQAFKLELGQADELAKALEVGVFAEVLGYLTGPAAGGATPRQPNKRLINTLEKAAVETKPRFVFDPEDEEEARAASKQVVAPAAGPAQIDWLAEAQRLVASPAAGGMTFGSDLLRQRLEQSVMTYLKGVRSRLDTKQLLARPVAEGGVGLEAAAIDRLIAAADGLRQAQVPQPKVPQNKIPVPEDLAARELDPADLAKLKALGARDYDYNFAAEVEKLEQPKEIAPAKERLKLGKNKEKNAPVGLAVSAAQLDPYAWRRPKEQVGKVAMADVRLDMPKVQGPLDELRFLDLVVFRRLDREPQAAVDKVKEKIETLRFEGYSQRLEGIKAWRQSPLQKLYIKLGEEAMKRGRPVEELIKERAAGKDGGLSLAEFEAIMRLNRELRF